MATAFFQHWQFNYIISLNFCSAALHVHLPLKDNLPNFIPQNPRLLLPPWHSTANSVVCEWKTEHISTQLLRTSSSISTWKLKIMTAIACQHYYSIPNCESPVICGAHSIWSIFILQHGWQTTCWEMRMIYKNVVMQAIRQEMRALWPSHHRFQWQILLWMRRTLHLTMQLPPYTEYWTWHTFTPPT